MANRVGASGQPGHVALDALDIALKDKPRRNDHCFSEAAHCLSSFRNEMIDRQRGDGPTDETRERLARLNSVISVVLAGYFPLGNTPWGELERARGWLADLVAEIE